MTVQVGLLSPRQEKYGQDATNVGDEGGFAPNVTESDEALQVYPDGEKRNGFVMRALDVTYYDVTRCYFIGSLYRIYIRICILHDLLDII